MKESLKTLLAKYQVRKSYSQKTDFIGWLKDHAEQYGYELKEDAYDRKGRNLVVGDIETSKIIFTAHYDTPPNFIFPVVMGFSNWFSFLASQLLMAVPIFLFIFLYKLFIFKFIDEVSVVLLILPAILIIAYTFQIVMGFANKHNANDNTSGVATLISIMEELPREDREKVCFVFFDQEELGLLGSANFYKKYKSSVADKPLINFDCVGDGSTLNFITKKKFRNSAQLKVLEDSADKAVLNSSKKIRFAKAISNFYMSDQMNFPHGVGVAASKRLPVFGEYISKIHSKRDTKMDNDNIELLTKIMIETTKSI